jgi:hypothetical protein
VSFTYGDVVCCGSRWSGLSLLSIKPMAKYGWLREAESMRAVARVHQNWNLADFEQALKDYTGGESFFFLRFSSKVDFYLGFPIQWDEVSGGLCSFVL